MAAIKEIYSKPLVIQKKGCRPEFEASDVYYSLVSELKVLLAEVGVELILNKDNKKVFGQIALWYANDERFTGSLIKGLLIRGGIGTGKTKICEALIKCIFIGEKSNAILINTRELQEFYIEQNTERIQTLKQRKYLIIDDMGVENVEVKNWGNSREPFNDLFDHRYRNKMTTIITTNLVPSQIKEMYGDRILDRCTETLNDIVLDFKSLRK